MPTSCTRAFLLPQPWPTSPGSPQTFPQSSKIRGTIWLSRTLHQLWLMSLLSGQCLAIQIIKCVEYHPWEDNGMQNLLMFFLSSSLGTLPHPIHTNHSLTYMIAGYVSYSLSKFKQNKEWVSIPGFPARGSCSIHVYRTESQSRCSFCYKAFQRDSCSHDNVQEDQVLWVYE